MLKVLYFIGNEDCPLQVYRGLSILDKGGLMYRSNVHVYQCGTVVEFVSKGFSKSSQRQNIFQNQGSLMCLFSNEVSVQ